MATVTGADRRQRAQDRLAETHQQLAQLAAAIADGQRELGTIEAMVKSGEKAVDTAEHAADAAAAAVIDAQSEVLVSAGSADEKTAQAAYDAAVAANAAARSQLEKARQGQRELQQRYAAEAEPIRAKIAEGQSKQKELQRLVQSLELAARRAHHQAGLEALDVARERDTALQQRMVDARTTLASTQAARSAHQANLAALSKEHPELAASREFAEIADPHHGGRELLEAWLAFLETFERNRGNTQALGLWHGGLDIAQVLVHDQWTRETVRMMLKDTTPEHRAKGASILHAMMARTLELLDANDTQRARKLEQLPPAQ